MEELNMKAKHKPYVIIKHKGMSRKERRILRRLTNKNWRDITSDTSHEHKKEFNRLNIRRQYRVTRARISSGNRYIDSTHISKGRLQMFDSYMRQSDPMIILHHVKNKDSGYSIPNMFPENWGQCKN
ncbi:hypothetical protein D1872_38090 [compost metagenome]